VTSLNTFESEELELLAAPAVDFGCGISVGFN